MPPFELHRPGSVEEACKIAADLGLLVVRRLLASRRPFIRRQRLELLDPRKELVALRLGRVGPRVLGRPLLLRGLGGGLALLPLPEAVLVHEPERDDEEPGADD